MDALKKLYDARKEIYDYFGYDEGWIVYPIQDNTDYFWYTDELTRVCFSEEANNLQYDDADSDTENENDFFDEGIAVNVHLKNTIFRKDDYTAIIIDTQTDGNVFFSIFDNSKERPEVN